MRECHGDMHLGNMALIGGEVTIFDCIEFNEYFHWIDVINDAAFMVMDLKDHNRPDLAFRFLNKYLSLTGDYGGLDALPFYSAYRAMVRAKVACIQMSEPGVGEDEKVKLRERYHRHFTQAESYISSQKPGLIITHGVSGSGKTCFTQSLLERAGAVRIRSDVERKRMFGLKPLEKSGSKLDEGLYAKEANEKTYIKLLELSEIILNAGCRAIVDAAFLRRSERKMFMEMAQRLDVPSVILDFQVSENILRSRIIAREKEGRDASEANMAVLEKQLVWREPLENEEKFRAVTVDTEKPDNANDVIEKLAWLDD